MMAAMKLLGDKIPHIKSSLEVVGLRFSMARKVNKTFFLYLTYYKLFNPNLFLTSRKKPSFLLFLTKFKDRNLELF